ncbi:hypothetical protein ZHAS_00014480 [Anopheles sinensis]|uniref:Uncharacterized protein n=1 Tax=Anopheles sinensis TaxID=74873 RepID=A0A084W8E7_ANOSI|nr:hypothetical protein ZHAS_00014480 [Anopheles sinensis]
MAHADVPRLSPTVSARNSTPSVSPGTPLHLSVEFCANPPAYAARWLHGDRVYTPGNQYGSDVVAYGFTDLPTPFCKEARLTYVHMHENVPRRFYFVVSSSAGVAEAIFRVNLTLPRKPNVGSSPVSPAPPVGSGKRGNSFSPPSSSSSSSGAANVNGGLAGYKLNTVHSVPGNGLSDTGEELLEPEEIHFPIFGTGGGGGTARLGLPVAVASLASHWRRLLHALPLLLSLLLPPLLTL